MAVAIRIIKSPRPTNANLFAIEHEEQVTLIAKKVAEARGDDSKETTSSCAEKLRAAHNSIKSNDIDTIATNVFMNMQSDKGRDAMTAHGDLELDRILALLEG
jgi:hypothetical protein